ncbi:meiosis-specific protein MEI4 isoform X1 [Hippoglossus hippoglossus]|uniref:meiosis-specific protein MEI4 isoform X1 n=1 Tax=Hippoglossus hippoglossus TaxID=8267 RepID=UPI00148CCD86|nr:meiosis-specific protein MEI4 isoform X1 [Hippoglossus hippoglossus]
MTSGDGCLKGVSPVWQFGTKAQVAVAVAIIKSKPAGMSGREHAEALGCRLRSQDESWRGKAQELQQEVLRLRQELLITKVTAVTRNATETAGPDAAEEDTSQDLFGPSQPQPDCDSETPELFQEDLQPAASPPEPPTASSHHERAMHPHVHFLQSLCALHRVAGDQRGLEALWFSPDGGAGTVLADSVCQLLHSVVVACGDPPALGPCDLVLRACQVAARAMDLFCSQRLPSAEFMRRVEGSLREMTAMLLHNQPCRLQTAEKLMEYLVTLGSSNMSKSFVIRHILSQISAVADELWHILQGGESSRLDQFPVDRYHNSCHLFWILEQLLQNSEVPCRVETGSEQTGFLRHLEQHLFLLSDEFPLFAIYMWRIGSLLTSSGR